jgi:hypothetical protein
MHLGATLASEYTFDGDPRLGQIWEELFEESARWTIGADYADCSAFESPASGIGSWSCAVFS